MNAAVPCRRFQVYIDKYQTQVKRLFNEPSYSNACYHESEAVLRRFKYRNCFISWRSGFVSKVTTETQFQKRYLQTCAPSEDSYQPAHSRCLVRIFPRHIFNSQWCKVYSCRQRRFWSDHVDVQADLSLLRACMSEGMSSHVASQLVT